MLRIRCTIEDKHEVAKYIDNMTCIWFNDNSKACMGDCRSCKRRSVKYKIVENYDDKKFVIKGHTTEQNAMTLNNRFEGAGYRSKIKGDVMEV
jgi:hypothetical protein